jgi:hypothetical protein
VALKAKNILLSIDVIPVSVEVGQSLLSIGLCVGKTRIPKCREENRPESKPANDTATAWRCIQDFGQGWASQPVQSSRVITESQQGSK